MLSISRLKPSHLRLLLRIAETGKLQLAADDLAISQPAASRILAEIETDIGAAIFERMPRGMVPTGIGATFLRRASQILSEFDTLENELHMIRSGKAGKVRIGAVTGPAVGYVVPAIRHLRQTAPDVEVTVHVAPSAELARGLEERTFDFIIARLPAGHDATDLELTPARTERVALLVNKTHPLATTRGCTLAMLRQHEWVMQDRGTPIRQAVERCFFLAGQALPAQISNSSSLLVALTMLAGSDVITPQAREVADLLTESGIGANLAVLDIADSITVEPYFVIRNRHHPATEAVMHLYRRVLDLL